MAIKKVQDRTASKKGGTSGGGGTPAPAPAATERRTPKNSVAAAANGGKIDIPARLAKKYNIDPPSIKFTADGFPIWPPHVVRATVDIQYTGSRNADFTEANRLSREKYGEDFKQGENETWHHHENMTTMQLVPEDLHDAVDHSGGVSEWMQTQGVEGKYGREAAREKAAELKEGSGR